MKNNSFDNIIKEKVAVHQAPVPADAWDNIKKEKRKRPGIFWWTFAALFIGFSLFGFYEMTYKRSPALTATQTGEVKNTAVKNREIQISDSSNMHIGTQPQITTVADSVENNTLINEPKANTVIIPADEVLPDPGDKDLTKTGLVKPSLNKNPGGTNENKEKPGGISVKEKTKKTGKSEWQLTGTGDATNTTLTHPALNKKIRALHANGKKGNATAEMINGNDVVTVKIKNKKPVINKKDKEEELWTVAENEKNFSGKTKIKFTAPATDAAGENETANTTAIAATKKIKAVEPAVNNDSLHTKPEIVITKQLANTHSTAKPAPKETKQNKRKLFVDIGIMPFVPVQNNAALVNIKRTTVNSLSRSEFTAGEIHTTVNASFSYNIALRKKLAANWYAGLGLQYTQIKETIKLSGKETNTRFSVVKRLDNTGSFLVDDTVAAVTHGKRIIDATNSYQFISIPVFAQYSLWEKKAWSLVLNGGLIFNVKSTYKNSIEGPLIPTYSSAGMANKPEPKLTTGLFAGMRLARTIGSNYQVYIEPTFQFNLQNFYMQNMINYKNIHKAGLTVGLAYRINY